MLSVAISFPHSTLAWDEVYWNMISLGPRPRASKLGTGLVQDHVKISAQHTKEHNGSTKISRSPTDVLRAAILWYQEGEASRLHVHDEASAPAARQDGEGRGEDMRTSLAPFLSHSLGWGYIMVLRLLSQSCCQTYLQKNCPSIWIGFADSAYAIW